MVAVDRYMVDLSLSHQDLAIIHDALTSLGEAITQEPPGDSDSMEEYEKDQEFGIKALALAVRIGRLMEPTH